MLQNLNNNKRTISILGDSYSTFEGYVNDTYAKWYPNESQHVEAVEQIWWYVLCDKLDMDVIVNSSYSGSTVCNTGYGGEDSEYSSFITRMKDELNENTPDADILLVFGGTNDFWSGAPVGQIKYDGWDSFDLKQFAPAFCYMMDYLKNSSNSKLYNVINDELPAYIRDIMIEVCKHYDISYIELNDIEKIDGHPTNIGMKQIAEQIAEKIKPAITL